MDFSTARSERNTAIVSTLVAVAILAGGVTAYQSHNAPVDDVVQLESDLRFQLEVAFLHDTNERARRLEQLGKISQAWQQSSRTETDHEKLATWLLESTIRSMPGSIEALPTVPHFGEQASQSVVEPSLDEIVQPLAGTANPESAVKTFQATALPIPATTVSAEFAKSTTISSETIVTPQPFVETSHFVEAPVRINFIELAARTAGYHEGLDEVEQKLLTLKSEDFSEIAVLIRQLEGMARNYRFIKLYHDSLTDAERQAVAAPRPLAATLAEIELRIDRTQVARTGDFLGEFDSNSQEQIAGLRQLLSTVTRRADR